MKVNVLQVEQAKFKNSWCWWSQWIDVAVFDYGCRGYLLQMKISRLNRKEFIAVAMSGIIAEALAGRIGDLTQMSREDKNEN